MRRSSTGTGMHPDLGRETYLLKRVRSCVRNVRNVFRYLHGINACACARTRARDYQGLTCKRSARSAEAV